MKDRGLEMALGLAGQLPLVELLERVEAGGLKKVVVQQSVGFADDRELHDRVVRYIRSCGAEAVLAQDGRPIRHPLPD